MGNKTYKVGYGKPPKSGQFQKGRSGNPKGRPKKSANNFGEALIKELGQLVTVTTNGVTEQITKSEAIVRQLINKAIVEKDIRAIKLIESLKYKYDPTEEKSISPALPDFIINPPSTCAHENCPSNVTSNEIID